MKFIIKGTLHTDLETIQETTPLVHWAHLVSVQASRSKVNGILEYCIMFTSEKTSH